MDILRGRAGFLQYVSGITNSHPFDVEMYSPGVIYPVHPPVELLFGLEPLRRILLGCLIYLIIEILSLLIWHTYVWCKDVMLELTLIVTFVLKDMFDPIKIAIHELEVITSHQYIDDILDGMDVRFEGSHTISVSFTKDSMTTIWRLNTNPVYEPLALDDYSGNGPEANIEYDDHLEYDSEDEWQDFTAEPEDHFGEILENYFDDAFEEELAGILQANRPEDGLAEGWRNIQTRARFIN